MVQVPKSHLRRQISHFVCSLFLLLQLFFLSLFFLFLLQSLLENTPHRPQLAATCVCARRRKFRREGKRKRERERERLNKQCKYEKREHTVNNNNWYLLPLIEEEGKKSKRKATAKAKAKDKHWIDFVLLWLCCRRYFSGCLTCSVLDSLLLLLLLSTISQLLRQRVVNKGRQVNE